MEEMLTGNEEIKYKFEVWKNGIFNDRQTIGFAEYMNRYHVDAKTSMKELNNCISEGGKVEVVNMFKEGEDE